MSETKMAVKKYLLVALVFFLLAAVIMALQFWTDAPTEKNLGAAAREVMAKWTDAAIVPGDRITIDSAGLSYIWAFEALANKKQTGIIFIVPLTGNSGPVTGVFYRDKKNGTQFCGLAGIDGKNPGPERNGISQRILMARMHQLDAIDYDGETLK